MIKAILNSKPVLFAPDFQKQFKLTTDESDIRMSCGGWFMQEGGFLMQQGGPLMQEDGIDHPISYLSKKFDKHQWNYSTIEKEDLAPILTLEHFDVYLGTKIHPVLVFTDYKPLTFIHRMEQESETSEAEFDLARVQSGKDNVVADALSRIT